MSATVYIETTVPSAYVSSRTDPGSQYRREITRTWWNRQLKNYDAFVSDTVLLELEHGEWPGQIEAVSLADNLACLETTQEIKTVAARYIEERLAPRELPGDALHLAAACIHQMDFLLTWNIRHLANPNKSEHLIVINRRLGLLTPQIVTPEWLWMEETT